MGFIWASLSRPSNDALAQFLETATLLTQGEIGEPHLRGVNRLEVR